MSGPSTVPTIGRIVLYQTDGRGGYRYALPAIIVRTRSSTDPKAVADGKVAELPDETTVDLLVFSCGGESYGENGVAYSEPMDAEGYPVSRCWFWPPRV